MSSTAGQIKSPVVVKIGSGCGERDAVLGLRCRYGVRDGAVEEDHGWWNCDARIREDQWWSSVVVAGVGLAGLCHLKRSEHGLCDYGAGGH